MIYPFGNYIYFFILYVFALTGPQPIHNSFLDLPTITPTGGLFSQTPTHTSSIPSQTYTPSVTPSVTPTTTLMPLPAITLIFPAPMNSPTAIETAKPEIGTQTPISFEKSEFKSVSPRMKVLTIMLVLLWLFLAGFLVIYIRQFG